MGSANKTGFVDEIKGAFEANIEARISLLQIDAAEKAAKLVSVLTFCFMIGSLMFFAMLFISLVAGYYFASITNSLTAGFGIVASFYVALTFLMMMFRKKLATTVIDFTIKTIFDKTGDDDDDEEDED